MNSPTPGEQSAPAAPPHASVSDAAGPQDLRTRRRRWMQDDLARAAVKLFLERGYDAVSVDEIAAAAGISERTFFRYFPTKEAVLRRYRQTLSTRLLRLFTARPDSEAATTALRNAYVDSAHVPEAERPAIHSLELLLATTNDVWAKDLGEAISDASITAELARRMGVENDDLRAAVFAAAMSAAAATGWAIWARSPGEMDPSIMVADAIDLLGLGD